MLRPNTRGSVNLPYLKNILFIFSLSLLLLACKSNDTGDPEISNELLNPSPTVAQATTLKSMGALRVDQTFDWKVTQKIDLHLTLLDKKGLPFTQQAIEIYTDIGNAVNTLPDDASLIFSGWVNARGVLNLSHQVKKGDRKLILKVSKGHVVIIKDIPLHGIGFDAKTSTLNVTLHL